MIEVEINEDIRKYKPKFIGPFTTKQCICLALGTALSGGIYVAASPYLSTDVTGFLCFLFAVPFIIVGWVEPYGMSAEDFIKSTMISMVLAPKIRKKEFMNSHNRVVIDAYKSERKKIEKNRRKIRKKESVKYIR